MVCGSVGDESLKLRPLLPLRLRTKKQSVPRPTCSFVRRPEEALAMLRSCLTCYSYQTMCTTLNIRYIYWHSSIIQSLVYVGCSRLYKNKLTDSSCHVLQEGWSLWVQSALFLKIVWWDVLDVSEVHWRADVQLDVRTGTTSVAEVARQKRRSFNKWINPHWNQVLIIPH